MDLQFEEINVENKDILSLLSDFTKHTVFIPKYLTECKIWKSLSPSAKEIYTILAANYNYQEGLSKITHTEIQNESGIGSRATLVKSLNALKEAGVIHVVEIGTKNNLVRHNYLMPYQEVFFAKILNTVPRDFSHYNPVKPDAKPKKKKKNLDDIHPLFFKVCHKFICLKAQSPEKVIGEYSDDGYTLRIISFMCDATYIIQKHDLLPGKNAKEMLLDFIKDGNISRDAFGSDITKRVMALLKEDKEHSVE